MVTPKLSIAMACYNSERFLKKAIKSITKNTFKDWELVVVDDCSNDKSVALIKQYARQFSIADKVHLRCHSKNKGYGTTMADAIHYCTGELVAIVDSDDAVTTDAFQVMVEAHNQQPGASLIYSTYYCNNNRVTNKGNIKRITPIPEGHTYLDDPKTTRVSHIKVFKKAAFDKANIQPQRMKGVSQELRGMQKFVDRALVLHLEEQGDLVFIDKPLYFHRKHPGNITARWGNTDAERRELRRQKAQMWRNARKRRGIPEPEPIIMSLRLAARYLGVSIQRLLRSDVPFTVNQRGKKTYKEDVLEQYLRKPLGGAG